MFKGPFGFDGPEPKPITMADLDAMAEYARRSGKTAAMRATVEQAIETARRPWLRIDPDTGEMGAGEGMP